MIRLFSVVLLRMLVVLCVALGVMASVALWLLGRALDMEPGDATFFAIVVPVAAMLLTLVIALLALRPWEYLSVIDAMVGGEAWAHWQYDKSEWRAANQVESQRIRQQAWISMLALVAVGLAAVVAGTAISDPDGRTVVTFAGAFTAATALVYLIAVPGTSEPLWARTRRTGEIYLGPIGIYRRPGGFTAFFGYGFRLLGVELVGTSPACLRFHGLVQRSGGATGERVADVVVPAGHEDEARRLVERFQAEVFGDRDPGPATRS